MKSKCRGAQGALLSFEVWILLDSIVFFEDQSNNLRRFWNWTFCRINSDKTSILSMSVLSRMLKSRSFVSEIEASFEASRWRKIIEVHVTWLSFFLLKSSTASQRYRTDLKASRNENRGLTPFISIWSFSFMFTILCLQRQWHFAILLKILNATVWVCFRKSTQIFAPKGSHPPEHVRDVAWRNWACVSPAIFLALAKASRVLCLCSSSSLSSSPFQQRGVSANVFSKLSISQHVKRWTQAPSVTLTIQQSIKTQKSPASHRTKCSSAARPLFMEGHVAKHSTYLYSTFPLVICKQRPRNAYAKSAKYTVYDQYMQYMWHIWHICISSSFFSLLPLPHFATGDPVAHLHLHVPWGEKRHGNPSQPIPGISETPETIETWAKVDIETLPEFRMNQFWDVN